VLRAEGGLVGQDLSLTAVGRDRKIGQIELARGDRIRFGENLPQFRIRNGTRGVIELLESDSNEVKLAVRLDDGRLIQAPWQSLVREQTERRPYPPRITSAYAGTAYSVQGRTSAAAVLYVAKPTDARETYVGLTRHKIDAYIVAERTRLEAAVRQRQLDPRLPTAESTIRERLFTEARVYAEKRNAADYVEDRVQFTRSGQIKMRDAVSLNLGRVARAAQRIFEAAREISGDQSVTPVWWLIDGISYMHREVAQRVSEIVGTIRARIDSRTKERAAAHP
jgi:hypothetical protein